LRLGPRRAEPAKNGARDPGRSPFVHEEVVLAVLAERPRLGLSRVVKEEGPSQQARALRGEGRGAGRSGPASRQSSDRRGEGAGQRTGSIEGAELVRISARRRLLRAGQRIVEEDERRQTAA